MFAIWALNADQLMLWAWHTQNLEVAITASNEFPYERELRMRPAYLPNADLLTVLNSIDNDPFAFDLVNKALLLSTYQKDHLLTGKILIYRLMTQKYGRTK